MSINFFELEEIAKKVQLPLEQTEKELFHNILLYTLFNSANIKKYVKNLAFKGGTCLYKCHGLPRFSEDLDFDILAGKLSRKNIDSLFNQYATNILREVFGFNNVNFRIEDNPTGFNIHTNLRGPAFSQTHRACHVKFDLSSRKKLIYNCKRTNYEASVFLKYYNLKGKINLNIVDPREIFAEKIVAILDKNFLFGQRDEARDLFDIYILLLKGHSCKIKDIINKLPKGKKEVFTAKNIYDSIYKTTKEKDWNIMIRQLIIEPKLKELNLSIKDISFNNTSKYVINRINSLYFK